MIAYRDFRTGLTYRAVYQMLWSPSEDTRTWRYKGRSGVLGLWHAIKRDLYDRYVGQVS